MLKLTTLRGVIIAVAALALVAGCTGGGHAKPDPASSLGPFAPNAPPTGAPVTLTQIQGAKGDKIPLGDGLSIVVPAGSKAQKVASKVAGSDVTVYGMPDASAAGFPVLQVSWGANATTGAVESSWAHEHSAKMNPKLNPAVSHYSRSSATWPGAKVAVVATSTEEVPTTTGTLVTDALALWVQTPSGRVAMMLVGAPKGQLDGSTALNALRSLTIG